MTGFGPRERELLTETHTLLKTHVHYITQKAEDHEQRLRKIEKRQHGILATIALLFSGAGATASQYWHKFF